MQDKFLVTWKSYIDELAMLLGGRVPRSQCSATSRPVAQNDLERRRPASPADSDRVRHVRSLGR
jgi:hypothetical protein